MDSSWRIWKRNKRRRWKWENKFSTEWVTRNIMSRRQTFPTPYRQQWWPKRGEHDFRNFNQSTVNQAITSTFRTSYKLYFLYFTNELAVILKLCSSAILAYLVSTEGVTSLLVIISTNRVLRYIDIRQGVCRKYCQVPSTLIPIAYTYTFYS